MPSYFRIDKGQMVALDWDSLPPHTPSEGAACQVTTKDRRTFARRCEKVGTVEPWMRTVKVEEVEFFSAVGKVDGRTVWTSGSPRLPGSDIDALSKKIARAIVDETRTSFQMRADIKKADADKRQVFGWFNVQTEGGEVVLDSDTEYALPEDIEDAIYEFNLFSREGHAMHQGELKSALIESIFFSKEKQDLLGIDLGRVGWWGGFYVGDDAVWEAVKSGELPAFSIGGIAERD